MLAIAFAKHAAAELSDVLTYNEGPGGNLFVDFMPSDPDLAVAVMTQPGAPSLSKLPDDEPGIQFLVRGPRLNPRTPYELAVRLFDVFTCLDNVTLDEGGPDEVYLVGCSPLQSQPTPIGQDSNQRHEYSLNFGCHTWPTTTHRS